MLSRRKFTRLAFQAGLATASAPLWLNEISERAFAQSASPYQAVVVVTMGGGNDSNNMLIPMDSADYQQYSALRPSIAIPQSACNILSSGSSQQTYGLHPALSNVAGLYNNGNALVVANVGPLSQPVTKSQLLQQPDLVPQALLSHPAGIAQWESATALALPPTGWGGRIADVISGQSGALPPVLDVANASIFTVGRSVQGIVVQGSATSSAYPIGMLSSILAIASADSQSSNLIVSQAAQLRIQAMKQQALLAQAQTSGPSLKTQFPNSSFGQQLQTVASTINGRSVVGATRQIFYCQQGSYDTHENQLTTHSSYLEEFDGGIGAFISALHEMGLTDQVLLCTHSDFNRTMIANGSAGTDHAWGGHQLVIGGGVKGGRIIGTYPDLELNGSLDFNGAGTWIPSLSVTQMTAGIGTWMGLSSSQIAGVFPDLANFPTGAVSLI